MTMLIDYCNANEFDLSRAVDDLLSGRLTFMATAKEKAEKAARKEKDHIPKRDYALMKKYDIPRNNVDIFVKWYNSNNFDELIATGQISESEIQTRWSWAIENPASPKGENDGSAN